MHLTEASASDRSGLWQAVTVGRLCSTGFLINLSLVHIRPGILCELHLTCVTAYLGRVTQQLPPLPPLLPTQQQQQRMSQLSRAPWQGFRHTLPSPLPSSQAPEQLFPVPQTPPDAAAGPSTFQPANLSREPRMAGLLQEPHQQQAPAMAGIKRSWDEAASQDTSLSPQHLRSPEVPFQRVSAQPSFCMQLPLQHWATRPAVQQQPAPGHLLSAGTATAMWQGAATAHTVSVSQLPFASLPNLVWPQQQHWLGQQALASPPSSFGPAVIPALARQHAIHGTDWRHMVDDGSLLQQQRAMPPPMLGHGLRAATPPLQRSANADALLRALDDMAGMLEWMVRTRGPATENFLQV